jgi:hypothetical protein
MAVYAGFVTPSVAPIDTPRLIACRISHRVVVKPAAAPEALRRSVVRFEDRPAGIQARLRVVERDHSALHQMHMPRRQKQLQKQPGAHQCGSWWWWYSATAKRPSHA